MIELIRNEQEEVWFSADGMKPLQVCVTKAGEVVMRTASTLKMEVIDLSKSGPDTCWTGNGPTCLMVRALRPGETYTLKLS